jgi:hypothetical protein
MKKSLQSRKGHRDPVAADQVIGWHLYVQIDRKKREEMLTRINQLKAVKYVVMTLYSPVSRKREDDERSDDLASRLSVSSTMMKKQAEDETFPEDDKVSKDLKGHRVRALALFHRHGAPKKLSLSTRV